MCEVKPSGKFMLSAPSLKASSWVKWSVSYPMPSSKVFSWDRFLVLMVFIDENADSQIYDLEKGSITFIAFFETNGYSPNRGIQKDVMLTFTLVYFIIDSVSSSSANFAYCSNRREYGHFSHQFVHFLHQWWIIRSHK